MKTLSSGHAGHSAVSVGSDIPRGESSASHVDLATQLSDLIALQAATQQVLEKTRAELSSATTSLGEKSVECEKLRTKESALVSQLEEAAHFGKEAEDKVVSLKACLQEQITALENQKLLTQNLQTEFEALSTRHVAICAQYSQQEAKLLLQERDKRSSSEKLATMQSDLHAALSMSATLELKLAEAVAQKEKLEGSLQVLNDASDTSGAGATNINIIDESYVAWILKQTDALQIVVEQPRSGQLKETSPKETLVLVVKSLLQAVDALKAERDKFLNTSVLTVDTDEVGENTLDNTALGEADFGTMTISTSTTHDFLSPVSNMSTSSKSAVSQLSVDDLFDEKLDESLKVKDIMDDANLSQSDNDSDSSGEEDDAEGEEGTGKNHDSSQGIYIPILTEAVNILTAAASTDSMQGSGTNSPRGRLLRTDSKSSVFSHTSSRSTTRVLTSRSNNTSTTLSSLQHSPRATNTGNHNVTISNNTRSNSSGKQAMLNHAQRRPSFTPSDSGKSVASDASGDSSWSANTRDALVSTVSAPVETVTHMADNVVNAVSGWIPWGGAGSNAADAEK
jgi:hypothetical protein